MVESYAWRLEAAVWRKKGLQESAATRCKPHLLLAFDQDWQSHQPPADEYDVYGYIEHYERKPERWLVRYFPMDARDLEATYHHEAGWGGLLLRDGEKCEPRDTAKDAAKYLLDLAADDLKISKSDYEALLIVSTDFLELLHKLNKRYLGRYPGAS
jgi:hypothetical protein